MARCRSSPSPTIASAKSRSHLADRVRSGRLPFGRGCCAQIWRARRARTCSAMSRGLRVKRERRRRCLRGWSAGRGSRCARRAASAARAGCPRPRSGRHDVLDQLLLLLRQVLEQLLHLGIGQQVRHVGLQHFGEVRRDHGRGVDDRVALDLGLVAQRRLDPGGGQAEGRLGGVHGRAGDLLRAGRVHHHELVGADAGPCRRRPP